MCGRTQKARCGIACIDSIGPPVMTKKNRPAKPAKPAKRKRAIPKTPRVPVPPPLCAHPRLVHGFLVRLAEMPNGPADAGRPISIDATPIRQRASVPVDVRHEGPGDDATFH